MRSITQDGPLAQLVEQWTFNPLVVSSSLTRPTIHRTLVAKRLQGFFIGNTFSLTIFFNCKGTWRMIMATLFRIHGCKGYGNPPHL